MPFADDLYIAKKIIDGTDEYGNEISHWDKPKKYRFSYMPLGGQVDYAIYGALINNMYSAILDMSYLSKLHSGDLAYMIDEDIQDVDELAGRDMEDKYCSNANYRVKLVQKQNFRVRVLFERINSKEVMEG